MWDVEDEDDLVGICRDEACKLRHIHQSHVFSFEEPSRRQELPWWEQRDPTAHLRADPRGLREAIRRLFLATDWPLVFRDIKHAVYNDYGSTDNRAIHRHIRKLIEAGFVAELELGLVCKVYIRSDSRLQADPENLRDHIEGKHAIADRRALQRAQLQAVLHHAI